MKFATINRETPLGKLLRLTIFIKAMSKKKWIKDKDLRNKVIQKHGSLDALMDASGAGMSVYDGVIQPVVSGVNSIIDTVDKKEEGGGITSKNDIYKPFYAVRDNTDINGNGINYNIHDGNKVSDQPDITKEVSAWLPVIGDFMDLKDFYDSYKSGDKTGMLLAAAGLVPLIGGVSSNINRARRGIKKVARSEHDIIKDDKLVLKFPKYAKPNSPIGDALNRHRLRLERGTYRRLVGEDPSIIGFDKDRNPVLDFSGIDFDLKSVKDKSSIEALMDDFGISEKEAIEYLKSVEDEPMFAVGSRIYWNPDILDKGGEEIKLYLRDGFNEQSKNAMVSHEVDHIIHTPNEKPEGNGFDFSKLSDDAREYFSYENGTEIAARGSQVKDYFGMTNDAQQITPEMLEYAKRHYIEDYGIDNNMSDFFNSITDFEKAAKWLSANASAGLGTYWLLDRNLKPDKDKVEIKYQKKLDGGSIFLYGFRRIPENNIYIPKPIKEKMKNMKNGGIKKRKDDEVYQLIADKFSAMYQEDVERVGRGEPARFFGQLNDKPLENVNPEFDLLFSPVKGLGSAAKAGSSYGISSEAVGRAGSILKEIGTGVLRWDDILRNGTRMMVDEVGKRLSGKAKDFWDKYPGGLIKAFVGRNATNMLPGMIGLGSEDNNSVSFQEAFKEASDQGLNEFEWNGKVYTTDKKKNGGVIGLKLSESDEKKFKDWYGRLSEYKGLNPDPDDANQYYDYRGFWKENPELAERMLNDDPDAHFVDTYKLPGHPTFSNESKYGGRELGGEWVVGDDGRGYYKPSPYTSSYIDRTIDYLRGSGEGVIINSEPIMIPEIPVKYKDGGASSISYQNMKDKMSDLYKEDIERIRNGKPAVWYKSLNDKPIEESHPEALLFPYAGVIQGIIDEAEDYENTGSLSGVASNVLFSIAGSLIPKTIRDPLLYLSKLGVKPARAKKLAEAIEESNLNRYERFHRYKTVGDRDVVPVGDKEKLFHNMNRDKLRWNEGRVELTPARTFKKGDPDALWWQAGSPHRGMDHGVYVIDKDKANVIGRGTAERQTWGSIDGEGAYLTGSQELYDTEFYEIDNLTGTTFRHVFKRDGGLIEKQDYIYNRLTSEYDIPPMQAAAIVANLTHESGLQTGALGDSGASYGIQQWRDERRKNLYQFAKEKGHVEPTMDDQVDYLMYEYNNGRAFQFSTRGQNLYQTGKSKNKTFDYYQFSKSDFDNAASLRDAVIAWNQGVGRPNKEFAMNDRRYKIAAEIAYRHGIKDGEKNYYNDMGYLPDGEMAGIHLPEVNIVANQPEQIPAEEQKKTDYYNTYGRQIVSQMMSFNPESQSTPTSQDVSKESDKMDQDAVRISKAIAENEEAEKRRRLIEAFLPNIQLAVKGVTQVGK